MYLDKKKTIAEGRKIPVEHCVEYPQMAELKQVLEHLGFEHAYEVKAAPQCQPSGLEPTRRGCGR